MIRLVESTPVFGARALPGSSPRKPRAATAVALGLWLCLAGGCQPRVPASPGGGTKAGAVAPGGQTGQTDQGAKQAAPANTPAGAPKTDQGAKQAAPANAPSGAPKAGGETAKVESPFPGQSTAESASSAAGTGSTASRVIARRDPDTIPGVPRLPLPPPRRSPFRLDGEGGEKRAAQKAAPEVTIRRREAGKPPGEPLGVEPLPPLAGPAPELVSHEDPRAPRIGNSTPVRGPIAGATPPALQLTGIIDGDPRMAVIEGETAHYIVREGDRVAGGYRVASISPQKVMLRSEDNRTVVLRFGRKGG